MNKLIAHGLMKIDDKYILIKRTPIKRGKPNSLPEYWDIPGGMVEIGESPQEAVIRETKEEVNLDITVGEILHEDSNYDAGKNTVFTRLVYLCEVLDPDLSNILLQEDEHSEFRLINNLDEMKDEKIVDYLYDTIDHAEVLSEGKKVLKKTRIR